MTGGSRDGAGRPKFPSEETAVLLGEYNYTMSRAMQLNATVEAYNVDKEMIERHLAVMTDLDSARKQEDYATRHGWQFAKGRWLELGAEAVIAQMKIDAPDIGKKLTLSTMERCRSIYRLKDRDEWKRRFCA